jgi:HK97 family phage portal protein
MKEQNQFMKCVECELYFKGGEILNRFQKAVTKLILGQSFSEYVQKFMSGSDLDDDISGFNIDQETALKYTAVFACNKVLAEAFASTPAMLYRKNKNGEREVSNDLSIYDILHNAPNDEMSPFNFKEACMTSLNLGGNSVCERLINNHGELVGLYPYNYTKVEIKRDNISKKLVYIVSEGAEQRTLTRNQVFHVPNMSLDGIVGLTPISYAASAIRLGISYEMFGVNFYRNGANASGAFKHAGTLSEEAFNRLKKELKYNYTGLKNTGTPMILEDGLEFQQFSITPVDAQLLESKAFQIEDIARIYRVPQHLIGLLEHATFSNIEQQSLEFVMYTMLPWFKRWEDNINMQLLTPLERKAGYYIEFKLESLLRGDIASRATYYAQGRQWGWLSVNDIRRLENMPAIGSAGDIYLQPLNCINAEITDDYF